MAEEAKQSVILITTPVRTFEDHEESVLAIAVFPDRPRMVTSGKTLRLWDLKDCKVLKTMEGHRSRVWAVAVSRDGQLIASGDANGELITWQGDTGESLTDAILAHSTYVHSLDFSPDPAVLATGSMSWDDTAKLWSSKTWEPQGSPIECSDYVNCVRYSPSGEHLAISTNSNTEIWNTTTMECITKFGQFSKSLVWMPDGTRLFSSGSRDDPTIREWDPSTRKPAGDPWIGHTDYINAIAVNPAGTLIASASDDNHVRLWRLSNRQTIAIFKHSSQAYYVTFSADGKHILSGGNDKSGQYRRTLYLRNS